MSGINLFKCIQFYLGCIGTFDSTYLSCFTYSQATLVKKTVTVNRPYSRISLNFWLTEFGERQLLVRDAGRIFHSRNSKLATFFIPNLNSDSIFFFEKNVEAETFKKSSTTTSCLTQGRFPKKRPVSEQVGQPVIAANCSEKWIFFFIYG